MMIEIKLGGEIRFLSTGMGALREIKKITGKDPFKWVQGIGSDNDSFEAIETVIIAGLRANGKEVSVDQVQKWVDDLNAKECIDMLTRFTNQAFGVEEKVDDQPGEVKAPMHK